MYRLYVLLIVIVITTSFSLQNQIIELTDSDLHNMTAIFPKLFVFYYVPWCQHSQKLMPIYELLAQQLQDEDSPIKLAKINVDENQKAYDFAQITKFPLLKYYNNLEEIQFDGDRTLTYLHNWLVKRISFPIKKINKHKLQLLRRLNTSEISVVYSGSIKSVKAAWFINMAYHDNYNHYYYFQQSPKPEGTIELLRSFDEDVFALLQPQQIQPWIRQHDRPLIVPLDERSITHIFRDGNKGVFFFMDPLHEKMKYQYENAAREWKKRGKNGFEVTFIAIYEDHQDFFGLMEYLDLHAVDRPLALVDGKEETKYIMNISVSKITLASLLQFYEKIEKRNVSPLPLEIHSSTSGLGCPLEISNQTENATQAHNISDDNEHFQQGEDSEQLSFAKKDRLYTLTREL